jgi:hypothetical protein
MKILIFNFFKTKHIQRSIFFFLILFTSINLSAQTKFTETFNNVKRGLSENDAAKTTQGTSGITYTRGPGTGIHKVANKDIALLIKTRKHIAAYIEVPLPKGVKNLEFEYSRPYDYKEGKTLGFTVTINGKDYKIETAEVQQKKIAKFDKLNIKEATTLRITHGGSNVGFIIDNLKWKTY